MRSKNNILRILVLGYIVRGPMGGMTWHHLQYLVGLHQLGHDVYFLEDSGDTIYSCYDPIRNVTDQNPAYGLSYAKKYLNNLNWEIAGPIMITISNNGMGRLPIPFLKL